MNELSSASPPSAMFRNTTEPENHPAAQRGARANRFLCRSCAIAGALCLLLFVVLLAAVGLDRPGTLAALSRALPWAGLALLAALSVLALFSIDAD